MTTQTLIAATATGWTPSLLGGLVAGGVCAFLGIAVSVALKDTAPMILMVGTLGSAVAGLGGRGPGQARRIARASVAGRRPG